MINKIYLSFSDSDTVETFTSLQKKNNDLIFKLELMDKDIKILIKIEDELEKQTADLKREVAFKDIMIDMLEKQVKFYREQCQDFAFLQSKINDLNFNLHLRDQDINNLIEIKNKLEKQTTDLKHEISFKDVTIDELKDQIKFYREQCQDFASLQSKINDLNFNLHLRQEDINNLIEIKNKLEKQTADLKHEVSFKDVTIDELKDQIKFYTEQSQDLAYLQSKINNLNFNLHLSYEDINNLTEIKDKLEKQTADLKREVSSRDVTINELKGQIKVYNEQCQDFASLQKSKIGTYFF